MAASPSLQSALILIDVINDFDFPEAEDLLQHALPIAERIADLKNRARKSKIPVIYVNDNFGRWQSDFRAQVRHCLREECPGRKITQLLLPDEEDYFVLKPRHSGFYSTTLELLLHDLQVRQLVLTGLATNICLLFTAHDAYMRSFQVIVPEDGCAANTPQDHDRALRIMETACKAKICPAADIDFQRLGEAQPPNSP